MSIARYLHSATLLANGKVLVAGAVGSCNGAVGTTELFDPSAGTFSSCAKMKLARYGQTANFLANGEVFFAGGYNTAPISDVEQFDPAAVSSTPSNQFVTVGSMAEPRLGHIATLLADGSVLVTGNSIGTVNSAEVYDAATGLFHSVGYMNAARYWHGLSLLQN